jgi:hypothetical protein
MAHGRYRRACHPESLRFVRALRHAALSDCVFAAVACAPDPPLRMYLRAVA